LIPIATPTSACLSDGASFTPSPVIATTAPPAAARAPAQLVLRRRARVHRFGRQAELAAMASAVAAWSPVIIFTSIPALRHCAIAAIASGRGGSMKPAMPRN
jgi:hypothetical protein